MNTLILLLTVSPLIVLVVIALQLRAPQYLKRRVHFPTIQHPQELAIKITLLFALLLVTGCAEVPLVKNHATDPILTNAQIIAAKNECEQAGMSYVLIGVNAPNEITRVVCAKP